MGWSAFGNASEGTTETCAEEWWTMAQRTVSQYCGDEKWRMCAMRPGRRQTLLPSVTCFPAVNVGFRLFCGPKEGPMGGFVMVQEWPGLLDVLAVLGWGRPIARGVWGLWCSNVQLEKRQSQDGETRLTGCCCCRRWRCLEGRSR
ncbi:predicted protein [Chaetomium globosum CBS 148.51]|uniref:Uncharacterized protein n=1 Tax=Chaetomium globosum (strain ATCC 6205 / CBS 148.51 / DSM 1962 / NBRC 6347 / NRRL 1970) TaxID=306901 RepID=Q2GY69_CHAGB|nr:uncharacterized protein CHGG_07085 [Chaetomium globosum CBS 148.51]EAQ85832.1 predicted protein [Chaetomium globosum CBS 148.51]